MLTRSVDTAQLKDAAVHIQRQDKNLHIKWGEVEVTLPAPSQETVNSLFKQYGGVIIGALVALASVVVGAGVVVAATITSKKDDT